MNMFIEWYSSVIPGFVDNVLWGKYTFIILLGVGILFTLWSKFIQYRAITHGVQVVRGKYDDKGDPGAINHFQALSAALSATVGLGNIGGVALAIGIGGPGALFWMWVAGFLGMAIKSVEVTLAMIYRDTSDPENPHGGAMWVIKKGFADKRGGIAKPLGWIMGAIFCVTLLISTMTGGNMFQVWNVANITNNYFGVSQIVTGIILAALTGMVIIGGIKRIGMVAGRIVPFMCGMYLLAGIVVLFVEAANVPQLLVFIVKDAFNPSHATGAFLGAGAWFGLTTGLRRALFSNEAGQGSSPIAHSAAKTDEPVREGVVAGLEPFIDTVLVCSLTALVILSTGTWNREATGDFRGDIAVVEQTDGNWVVQAPVSVDNLPELSGPDKWLAGNALFLIATTDEQNELQTNQKNHLVRVTGTLAPAPDDGPGYQKGDLIIVWDTPPAHATLRDKGVFQNFTGASLTGNAFDRAIPGLGKWLVTITCWLFALSTMISWSYYGEQGIVYLMGSRGVLPYKLVFCLLAVVASVPSFIRSDAQLGVLADLGTGVMLFANVPIIVLMGHQSIRAFKDYFGRMKSGQMEGPHATPKLSDVAEGKDVR